MNPIYFVLYYLTLGAVVLICIAASKSKKTQETQLTTSETPRRGYSHRSHYSDRRARAGADTTSYRQRQSRLLQKAKDQELRDYVLNSNREWASAHLNQQNLVNDIEGVVEDQLLLNSDDPFCF